MFADVTDEDRYCAGDARAQALEQIGDAHIQAARNKDGPERRARLAMPCQALPVSTSIAHESRHLPNMRS